MKNFLKWGAIIVGCLVVVIDILRASTTIVTALANGARAIIPAADMAGNDLAKGKGESGHDH